MKELLVVIGLFILLIISILIVVGLFSSIGHKPVSEYELYGENGADEWERKKMGLSRA